MSPSIRFGGNDDYTPPAVQMVKDGHSTYPEPPLDQAWTNLEKLRWQAALIELETGLRIRVNDSDFSIDGVAQRDYFNISVSYENGGSSSGPFVYGRAWDYLNGVNTGARMAASCAAVPLGREQRLEHALIQIRELAQAWADPDVGDQIIALIDRQMCPESGLEVS